MHDETTAYLLDAGNTQVKLGTVEKGLISTVKRFELSSFPWEELDGNIPIVISSVLSDEWKKNLEKVIIQRIVESIPTFIIIYMTI
jgi:hypothetical protein